MLLSLYLSLYVRRLAHLCIVPEGLLKQSLLDQSGPHFHLQNPLRPPPALVGVGGVEDEQHQQIYYLTWQSTFSGETYRFISPQMHINVIHKNRVPTCP